METYFVISDDIQNLQTALGRMIEYAKYLEREVGWRGSSFADEILMEEEICFNVKEN